jgi:hypothetical protein
VSPEPCNVTTEQFGASELDAGNWCFLIQQTTPIVTKYSPEFVMTGPVPAQGSTWGSIKALYR